MDTVAPYGHNYCKLVTLIDMFAKNCALISQFTIIITVRCNRALQIIPSKTVYVCLKLNTYLIESSRTEQWNKKEKKVELYWFAFNDRSQYNARFCSWTTNHQQIGKAESIIWSLYVCVVRMIVFYCSQHSIGQLNCVDTRR